MFFIERIEGEKIMEETKLNMEEDEKEKIQLEEKTIETQRYLATE